MKILCLALIALALSCLSSARAQGLEGTPLTSCPGYIADHPIVSELSWSVNCFLDAIHKKDRALAVAIAPYAKCDPQEPDYCFEGVEATASGHFFGEGPSVSSLYTLLTGTDSAIVTFATNEQNGPFATERNKYDVQTTVLVAPEKSAVNVVQGFMVDYFECTFAFDKARNIWMVKGICRLDVAEVDKSLVVDMSGGFSVLPALLWKPKK